MANNSDREVQLFSGFSTYAQVCRSGDIFYDLQELPKTASVEHQDYMRQELVGDILAIFAHQAELDVCSKTRIMRNFDSRCLARDALKLLGCEPPDQFFELATSLEAYGNSAHFPELHDVESDRHKELKRLITDSFAIFDQLSPGPYMGQ